MKPLLSTSVFDVGRSIFNILPLSMVLAIPAFADLPRKPSAQEYRHLSANSPFTNKPIFTAGPEVNPLEDYVLIGVAPVPGGYRVTLLNKKNPDERIALPDDSAFKIISVQYKSGDPLATTVRLATGGKEGTVSFNKDFSTPKAAAAAPPPQPGGQPVPGQPNPNVTPQPNANNPAGQGGQNVPPRPPRPRVVSPPPPVTPTVNPVPQPTLPQTQQRPQPRPNRR